MMVRGQEREIMQLVVKYCGMPRAEFIGSFPGNESDQKWLAKHTRSKNEYAAKLSAEKDNIHRPQRTAALLTTPRFSRARLIHAMGLLPTSASHDRRNASSNSRNSSMRSASPARQTCHGRAPVAGAQDSYGSRAAHAGRSMRARAGPPSRP